MPATKGEVFRVGDIVKAGEGWPADKKFHIPSYREVDLYCTRASGDWDTMIYMDEWGSLVFVPVSNELHPQWPRFQCNFGQFLAPEYDRGTHVVWRAPEYTTNDGVGITLFEQDVPFPISIPPDDGTVDDGGPNNGEGSYNNQDRLYFVVTPIEVELHIVNTVTQTTHSSPGPNARGILGIWWSTSPYNFLRWNGMYSERYFNGGTQYLGGHEFAVGTCLKTEIYAVVLDKRDLPETLKAEVQKNANWQFCQERRYGLYQNGNPSPDPEKYSADWVSDDESPYGHDSPIAQMDMQHDRRNGYLYMADAPGVKQINGGQSGDVEHVLQQFKTWVQFKSLNQWFDVVPKPSEPNWGCAAEVKNMAGQWIVTIPAAPM